MGSDMEYFRANDPFALAVKNADAIRDRTLIRIATHRTPGEWQSGRCEELHELLVKTVDSARVLFRVEREVAQSRAGDGLDGRYARLRFSAPRCRSGRVRTRENVEEES